MYFNEINIISEALHDGSIQWEGIARNVEYLGLSAAIKLFLSKWYHTWLEMDTMEGDDSDSDSDTEFSDSGDGDDSTYTAVDKDELIGAIDEKQDHRGRPREARPLSSQSLGSRPPST
jgi:hypothetical protein